MGNNIIIFTLDGCEYCDNLKNKLNNLNIPFQEFEITRNRTIWNQVIEQTGLDTLPTVFIREDYDDTGPVYMPGRDYESQEEILEIIKSYILSN